MSDWRQQVIEVFFGSDETSSKASYDITLIKSAEAQFAPFQLSVLIFIIPLVLVTIPLFGTYFFGLWLPIFILYVHLQTARLRALPDRVSRVQYRTVILWVLGNAVLSSFANIYCVFAEDLTLRYAGVLAIAISMVYALSVRADDPWLRSIYGASISLQLFCPPIAQYMHGTPVLQVMALTCVSVLGVVVYLKGLQFLVETRTRLRRAAELEFVDKNLTSLGQLTGGVAHDFNNLLTIILGNLDLRDALRDADPEGREELLAEVRDAAGRAADLTSQLLAFSRKSDLTPQRVELGQVIESSSALLQRLLPATHTLTLDLPLEPVHVRLDSKTFGTVMVNMVINARDAMVDGGELVVRLHAIPLTDEVEGLPPGEYARVEIRDHGVGMSPELLARAMEPFYTTKPVGKGSGMGLSMAHGFAEQSEGKLTLQSDLGIGTVVRLWFPLVE